MGGKKQYPVVCSYCGKEFLTDKEKYTKSKRHFCCRDHFLTYERESKNMVQCTCANCGTTFSRLEYRVRGKERVFCSQDCALHYKPVGLIQTTCGWCGKPIERVKANNKSGKYFCSKHCIGMYQSKKKPDVRLTCAYCGKEFMKPWRFYEGEGREYYCSKSCACRARAPLLQAGITEESLEKRRQSMLNRGECRGYRKYHRKQEHRVVAETMLGRKLTPEEVVHHIDGNKRNNDPDNLFVFPNLGAHSSFHHKLKKGTAPKLIGGKEQKIIAREGGDAQCDMSQESTNE